jgi:hypothetical protein
VAQTNREAWLTELVAEIRPLFLPTGITIPDRVQVSVGFPSRGGAASRNRVIGQCWLRGDEENGSPEVFISPLIDDGAEVAAIMAHELIHAAGIAGHGPTFRAPALALGLTGKMTATEAGDELAATLGLIVTGLGTYPHDKIVLAPRGSVGSRLLKVECNDCGYIARVTRKWLSDSGAPLCPCNGESMWTDDDFGRGVNH